MPVSSSRATIVVNRPEPAGGYAIAALLGAGLGMDLLVAGSALTGRSLSPFSWYLARASGMTLYLLLWLATFLGLGLTTTLLDRLGGRGVLFSLHAFATELSYGFLALHLLSLAADPLVPFALVDLVVPFAASWREPWTGFGVLAGGLLVVVGGSFGARRLIGYRGWRVLHWLTFPLFALAFLHGIGSGTDSATLGAQAIYATTGISVLWLLIYRVLRGGVRVLPPRPATPRPFDRLAIPRGHR